MRHTECDDLEAIPLSPCRITWYDQMEVDSVHSTGLLQMEKLNIAEHGSVHDFEMP